MSMNRRTGRTAFARYPCSAVFCLLAAVLFLSCRPPFGEPHADRTETAGLRISFSSSSKAGGPSRTVVPASDLGITSITVTVSDAAYTVLGTGTADSAAETFIVAGITPGSVTVTADAYAGATLVARGSENVSLTEGETRSLTIVLVPGGSGNGGYTFSMRWPKSTEAGYVEYRRVGGEPIPADVDGATDPDHFLAACAESDVPAGAHSLFITFYDNDSTEKKVLGAFVEAVNVYANLTSDHWLAGEGGILPERVFSEEELKSSLTELLRLEVRGADFSNPYSDPVPYEIAIGKSASPYLSFTPVLLADAGQVMSCVWNGADRGMIGSGAGSAPFALSDAAPIENGLNTLTVTVSPEIGEPATYTVTVVKAYRLSYDGNGSTGGNVPAGALYCKGEQVTAADNTGSLSRVGCTFSGWNTDPNGTGTPYDPDDPEHDSFNMDAASLTLYAQWIRNGTVGVSFSLPAYRSLLFVYSGEVVKTLTVTRNAVPLSIGYGGAGTDEDWAWYLDGVLDAGATTGSYSFDRSENGRYVVSCTVTYEGVRYSGTLTVTVVDEFSLSYDGNGAESGTVPSGCTFSSGETVMVAENTGVPPLTRSGYTWAGWSADHLAAVPQYTGTGSEPLDTSGGSVTLYAVWDNTAPAEVGNLNAETTADSLLLSWETPADRDFAGVRITGVSPESPEVTVKKGVYRKVYTGLTADTTYTFSVRAYDSAGNASEGVTVSGCTGDYAAYPDGGSYSYDVPGGTVAFSVSGGNVTISGRSGSPADIDIPSSIAGHPVTAVASSAFEGCSTLTSVNFPDSVTSLGSRAFFDCSNLRTVTIRGPVTGIPDQMFQNCTRLTAIEIPDSVTAIGLQAFTSCYGLNSVVVPDSVTSIGIAAFTWCTGLVSATIGSGVETIGDFGFSNCTALRDVCVRRPQPGGTALGNGDVFDQCTALTAVHVPAGSEAAYRSAAYWSAYEGIIVSP